MRILVFGDSITQGFYDDVMGGWCNRLIQYVIQKTVESDFIYNSSIFNLGISDDDTDNLVKRLPNEIKARLKDCSDSAVIFALGVNDSHYELESERNKVEITEYKKNLERCIKEAKKYTDRVFMISLLPIDESLLIPIPWKLTHGYKMGFINQYNKQLQEVAREQRCTFIDISDVFGDSYEDYLTDGIHPNAEGHRLIFERVKDELEKANSV